MSAGYCVCGKTEIVTTPGLTVTVRCPFCPPEKPPPILRLVKS